VGGQHAVRAQARHAQETPTLQWYLERARLTAPGSGTRTDLIDCLHDIYDRVIPVIGECDVAAILEYLDNRDGPNGVNA
jgi:hypothetical protein